MKEITLYICFSLILVGCISSQDAFLDNRICFFGQRQERFIVQQIREKEDTQVVWYLRHKSADTLSIDIPADSTWKSVDKTKYTFVFPKMFQGTWDNAFLKHFSSIELDEIARTGKSIGFVFTFNPLEKTKGLTIVYPDIPVLTNLTDKRWNKWFRYLTDSISLDDISTDSIPNLSRFVFEYPADWISDLILHLQTGWPVDHYTHGLLHPDLFPEDHDLRYHWSQETFQVRLQTRSGFPFQRIQLFHNNNPFDALSFDTITDFPLIDRIEKTLHKELTVEELYILAFYSKEPMYILLSFDTKKGKLTNIAFEYDTMTAYYHLTPSIWARIEKALTKHLRIDRKTKEPNNLTQYYKVVLTPQLFQQIGESKIKKVLSLRKLNKWNAKPIQ